MKRSCENSTSQESNAKRLCLLLSINVNRTREEELGNESIVYIKTTKPLEANNESISQIYDELANISVVENIANDQPLPLNPLENHQIGEPLLNSTISDTQDLHQQMDRYEDFPEYSQTENDEAIDHQATESQLIDLNFSVDGVIETKSCGYDTNGHKIFQRKYSRNFMIFSRNELCKTCRISIKDDKTPHINKLCDECQYILKNTRIKRLVHNPHQNAFDNFGTNVIYSLRRELYWPESDIYKRRYSKRFMMYTDNEICRKCQIKTSHFENPHLRQFCDNCKNQFRTTSMQRIKHN